MQINLNKEKNGIELSFETKPSNDILTSLKAEGFRWHNARKIWYAKQTDARLSFVRSFGDLSAAPSVSSAPVSIINMEGVEHKPLTCHGADLAKVIRQDLKVRNVKGVSVRSERCGYTTHIYVTVKATANDFASIEEAKERFNMSAFSLEVDRDVYIGDRWLYLSEYEAMTEEEKAAAYDSYINYQIKKLSSVDIAHNYKGRGFYWELTTAFYDKLSKIHAIANQWNHDNSDYMSDYYDVGYYFDIQIKKPDDFEPRKEMTEQERANYNEEKAQEEREREEEHKKYLEEQQRAKEEAEKHQKFVAESRERINKNIIVKNLEESEQLYITNLVGGGGKECTLEELKENINESSYNTDALISREIFFSDPDAFNRFSQMFLCDFDFIIGTGGTASEDLRLENIDIYKLTNEQRETVKFYSNKCIAVYFADKIQYIIDAQGYHYARYVYLLTDESEVLNASKELKRQENASKEKNAFYFPAPVAEQAENLVIGDYVTIFQCDGWILNLVEAGDGILTDYYPGKYAQYDGLYLELMTKNKIKKVFIRDNKMCLVYKGKKNPLPHELAYENVSEYMERAYNYNELIPRIYKYFKDNGDEPIINTWQH